MKKDIPVIIRYPEIGICGLSCRLCPSYHTDTKRRCFGCKSTGRMAVGCPIITCATRKKGIEFCWDCKENNTCEKWKRRRKFGKEQDSFKCYQTLEGDISFIQKNGVIRFEKLQKIREELLKEMLKDYNEGRSKSYYCIAATVLKINELQEALNKVKKESLGLDLRGKSQMLHIILNKFADDRKIHLKLRNAKRIRGVG